MSSEFSTAQEAVRSVPQAEWEGFWSFLVQEDADRVKRAASDAGKAEVVAELRQDAPAQGGEAVGAFTAWADPGTDLLKSYLKGDRVRHNGRVWESCVDGLNVWEPGAAGVYDFIWRDVTSTVLADAPAAPPESDAGGERGDTTVVQEEPETGGEAITQWHAGLSVTVGQKLTHNGITYTVVQAHTTQAGWEPQNVPALFKKVEGAQ